MNAIPTTYKNIRFRSRLEATWAAFFDLLQWSWEYEPFDLAGYIPDFVLLFNHREKPIVEVKPVIGFDQLERYLPKIAKHKRAALIVGAVPYSVDCEDPNMGIEYYLDTTEPAEWIHGHAEVVECLFCKKLVPVGTDGPCPWCGVNLEGKPGELTEHQKELACIAPAKYNSYFGWVRPDMGLLDALWATAKNRSQWKGAYS